MLLLLLLISVFIYSLNFILYISTSFNLLSKLLFDSSSSALLQILLLLMRSLLLERCSLSIKNKSLAFKKSISLL